MAAKYAALRKKGGNSGRSRSVVFLIVRKCELECLWCLLVSLCVWPYDKLLACPGRHLAFTLRQLGQAAEDGWMDGWITQTLFWTYCNIQS